MAVFNINDHKAEDRHQAVLDAIKRGDTFPVVTNHNYLFTAVHTNTGKKLEVSGSGRNQKIARQQVKNMYRGYTIGKVLNRDGMIVNPR